MKNADLATGVRVALHRPLDLENPLLHGLRDETGTVVRLRKTNGVTGADVHFEGELTKWVPEHHLHPVSHGDWHAWRVAHRRARRNLVAGIKTRQQAPRPDLVHRQERAAEWRAAWALVMWDRVTSSWDLIALRAMSKAGRITTVELPEVGTAALDVVLNTVRANEGDELALFGVAL